MSTEPKPGLRKLVRTLRQMHQAAAQPCTMPTMARKCKTCPFREGSPHENLRPLLTLSALSQASRVCHSTGDNAIKRKTGKAEKLCRGARDVQLAYFHQIGFIAEPTDAAWKAKRVEMGLEAEDGQP